MKCRSSVYFWLLCIATPLLGGCYGFRVVNDQSISKISGEPLKMPLKTFKVGQIYKLKNIVFIADNLRGEQPDFFVNGLAGWPQYRLRAPSRLRIDFKLGQLKPGCKL